MYTGLGGFIDFKASDLISGVADYQNAKLQIQLAQMQNQGKDQSQNLTAATTDSPSVAVDTGYAAPSNMSVSWLSSKWAIGGLVALAVSGLALAVVR